MKDYNTSTVSGAAAFAARHADPYHKYDNLSPCDFGPALSEIEEVKPLDTWGDLLALLQTLPKDILDRPIIGKVEMERMRTRTNPDGTEVNWFEPKGEVDAHLEEWVTHPDSDDEDYPQLRGNGFV